VDFLVDAFLYPIDIEGRPYLSKIDLGEQTLHFADSETGTEIGVAEFSITDTDTYVYEPEYERKIGVLVFGDGLSSVFKGATVRVFVPEQTPLAPTAFIPLNQPGVRGFILPDGTVVTGDVVFEGQDGVQVTSENTIDGIPQLRIDILGVPDNPTGCTDICDYIRTLCFEREAGSAIDFSQYGDNVLALYGSCYDLTDICLNQRLRRLPNVDGILPYKDDICTEPPPDPPVPCPDEPDEICFDIVDTGPYFIITNPSALDSTNPIAIQLLQQLGLADAPRLMQARPMNSFDGMDDQVRAFTNPPFMADGLVIGIRGLANAKRKRT
jgi:hypothetical protein